MLQIVLIYHGMKLIITLFLSHVVCYQRLAGRQSQWATPFAKMIIKRWFCSKLLCLLCCMLPACRLELMVHSTSSIGFNFQLHAGFGCDGLFPHNFSVLHLSASYLHRDKVMNFFFASVYHFFATDSTISQQIAHFRQTPSLFCQALGFRV